MNISIIFRFDLVRSLLQYSLPTLVVKVKKFCNNVPDQPYIILITAVNAQKFGPHSEDIFTDTIIKRSEYLAYSETWIENSMPVNVPGFDLRSYCKTAKNRQIATTSSVAIWSSSSRKTGGVSIYRNIRLTDCNKVNIDVRIIVGNSFKLNTQKLVVYIYLVNVKANASSNRTGICVYTLGHSVSRN